MNTSDRAMYTAYLEGSLKLSKTGEWRHNGQPFQNEKVAELFSRSIVWDDVSGRYYIQIGAQRATFECEDTAYFVLAIDDNKAPWMLALSDGSTEPLEPHSLTRGNKGQVYCRVHGNHRARFSRGAHQVLLRAALDDERLLIAGQSYKLRLE